MYIYFKIVCHMFVKSSIGGLRVTMQLTGLTRAGLRGGLMETSLGGG